MPDPADGPEDKGTIVNTKKGDMRYYVHWYAGLVQIPGAKPGTLAQFWSPYWEDALKMPKNKAGVEWNGMGGADLAARMVPIEDARKYESWATPKAATLEN